MASLARQNYHQDCEAAVNKQINLELHASYLYFSVSYYFDRDDVALPGFQAFYIKSSDRERKRAEKWMKFQNSRGGRIVFQDIQKPQLDEWTGAMEALQVALELEKSLNKSLLDLHMIAEKHNDKHMSNFIEG
ncbi:hypothetical protein LSH36_648g00040 [Paralvinella palmiformis]|uniref:Ferritin n=1 Tax=Paralvinella palmiformis TaxID=53620 RepID=A0AAD9MU49_9ANNE|nr:hypothetical protein LSH36_648g00040 [Paralvinella palmiformis]